MTRDHFQRTALLLAIVILIACASTGAAALCPNDSIKVAPWFKPGFKSFSVKPGVEFHYVEPAIPRTWNLRFWTQDLHDYWDSTFRCEMIDNIFLMTAGTAVLVGFDQQITNAAQELGRQINLPPTNHQRPFLKMHVKVKGKKYPLNLNFPTDLSSSLYFIGDGITHLSIALGLWGYGGISGDDRAFYTGAELIEAIACTGTVIQILKHATGRESPQVATANGGVWRLLPSPVEYGNHVPTYDAYPSGHIATAMATVTVIADNYPEKRWIRPAGYSFMGVLMFAMLNNGVHWASDYPLGIAIGYTFAKIADRRSHTVLTDPSSETKLGYFSTARLSPTFETGGLGVRFSIEPQDLFASSEKLLSGVVSGRVDYR